MYRFILLFALFASTNLLAQETTLGTTNREEPKAPEVVEKISYRKYKKTFHYKFYKHHEDLIEEFYDRQKQVAKRNKKWIRISKKPQYSDPTYFGHKRKPKIHKVSKRKLCKECKIIH